MPNENHEYINNVSVCTYTDAITSENPMSENDVYNCILSAGIPYERNISAWMKNDSLPSLNEPNSNNPWENGPSGVGVVHDTSALINIPSDNPESYFKIMYGTAGANATEIKVKKYRNVLNITPLTTTLNGQVITYYSWTITTQYGENNAWNNSVLSPYRIIMAGGKPCKLTLSGDHNIVYGYSEFSGFGGRTSICHYDHNILSATDGTTNKPENAPYYKNSDWDYELQSESDVQIYNDTYFTRYLQGVNYGGGGGFHAYGVLLISNIDYVLMLCALCGLKFNYNGTDYKPIVSGGIVTGYTTDMTTMSEWDNWETISDHTIPVAPPTPPKPDANDNEIDVTMSAFTPSAGFVRYIEMTYEKLKTLASSFNKYNASIWNIGGDLMKNLISLKVFACSGTHSGIIRNIHIAGHEMTDDQGNPIDGNYIDDLGVVDLGTIQVGSQFRFDDWRDYAPYTKIECFVPCCGWAQLPPWVMGRTVTGTLYIDVPNGSCKAVIKAGRTPVAEIGGCCAVDMPLSSVATGAKAAGIITSLANGAVSAFNPTPQNLISGSFGIMSAFNANFTETKGTMGDGSNINGCTEFLIKVTRPASTDTGNGEITNRYKHEKGLPCAKTKTLASGQGFTQIMDANIEGPMTDREKQMIIDGFRHGLIL